jgi:hypothetical protein
MQVNKYNIVLDKQGHIKADAFFKLLELQGGI